MTAAVDISTKPARARRRSGLRTGTTQRFVLLIVLFLASSTYMMSALLRPLTDPANMAGGCALAAGFNPEANSFWNQMITDTPAFDRCLDDYAGGRLTLALPYIATAVLVALAILLYALLPYWKRRPSRAVPVASVDADESLRAELARLASVAGLRRLPRFVVDLTALQPNAIVFGRLRRHTVRLDGGLVVLFSRDRRAFEATLLHEYAHIRNGDVDVTYLTVAIWRVFLIGVLIPFTVLSSWYLVSTALSRQPPGYWSASVPLLARTLIMSVFLVALTYLAMADVLRTREICADIEAIGNHADRTYWTRHVTAAPSSRNRLRATVAAVRAALRTHPDWPTRVAATADPEALFVISALPMFLTGVAVAILGYHLNFTQGAHEHYLWGIPGVPDYGLWPAATLATAVAGGAVWRGVTRSVSDGTPPFRGLRAGLWLGTGCLGGDLLVSQSLGDRWLPPFPQGLLLLAVVLVPAAVLWWTEACAELWADMRPVRRRLAAVLTLTVSGAALAWWFAWWLAAGRTFAGGQPLSAKEVLASLYGDMPPSTTMDVVAALSLPVLSLASFGWSVWLTGAMWIVPLAGLAGLARRGRAPAVRGLSVSATFGLLGGIAAGISLIIITSRAHQSIWHDKQPVLEAVTLYTAWFFAILFCAAAGAAFAASLTRRGNAATAMAAAGTAMAVALVVLFAVTQTDGCVPPLTTVRSTCALATNADWTVLSLFLPQLLAMAGMATLVTALLGALIAALLRSRRRDPGSPRTPDAEPAVARRTGRRAARLTWTAVACAVIVGACAAGYFGYFRSTESDKASNSDRSGRAFDSLFMGPVPAEVLDAQAWAWLYFGGDALLADYEQDIGELDHSVGSDGDVDVPAMRHACANLVHLPDRAAAYFPIPDLGQQSAWSAALANTATAAQKCLTGLDRSDGRTLSAAFRELNGTPDPVACIIDRIEHVAARAEQIRGITPKPFTVDGRLCPHG